MRHPIAGGLEAKRFEGDSGANLVEYAMLLALIVITCLSAMAYFGRNASGKMSCVSSAVTQQVSGITC
jgi:Flp pilus assembly pilin Flp